MTCRVHHYDAFSSEPGKGNPAGVVLDSENLPDAVMQQIATRVGFSETAFRVFVLMASRRLKSDRVFTDDYRPELYTEFGIDYIEKNAKTKK